MKVFISWSGEKSKHLGEAFREWLPSVIQAVKPYFSPDDISKGSRWNTEISKELEDSKIGLIMLTPDNLEAPWVMFECGALSKNIDKSKVCPILFEVKPVDIQGPLVQFQASLFTKQDIRKIVKMINDILGEHSLASHVFDSVFEMWWPKLNEKVESILKRDPAVEKELRTEKDLLIEILNISRTLSKEIRPRVFNVNPRMIEELLDSYLLLILACKEISISQPVLDSLNGFRVPIAHVIRVLHDSSAEAKFKNALEELSSLKVNIVDDVPF
ncbi:MAG: hypothetical protein A2054_01250 [Deltaproteobacteria bacterium GWA2_55_10]|nr:MAG: hypothetical protein A2054_01250 [Deltaproteobacteria bacterium GWA2_55_10]